MNIALKKISVAAIGNQWIKDEKYMVMGYANKLSINLMDRLYIRYVQITPGVLMKNQYTMQAAYHAK